MNNKHKSNRYAAVMISIAAILLAVFGVSDSTVKFDNLELTSLHKSRMHYLGLREPEMREFLLKREIYKGYIDSDKLSPHEVLGILSEDAAKRRQYARAAARIRMQLIDRTKNFETLYLQEVSRLTNPG